MVNIRIFFHLQMAYWYYVDFICKKYMIQDQKSEIQFYGWVCEPLRDLQNIRNNPTLLYQNFINVTRYHKKYKDYCKTIPLCGAILLNNNMDSVLLVMNFSKTIYSFPKGKLNQNEDKASCAVREVYEEVGYDISRSINNENFIDLRMDETGQQQTFFLITGVDQDFKFKTQTRNEIGKIEWVRIDDILNNYDKYSSLFPTIRYVPSYIEKKKEKMQQALNNEQFQPHFTEQKKGRLLSPKNKDTQLLLQTIAKNNDYQMNFQLYEEDFQELSSSEDQIINQEKGEAKIMPKNQTNIINQAIDKKIKLEDEEKYQQNIQKVENKLNIKTNKMNISFHEQLKSINNSSFKVKKFLGLVIDVRIKS